MIVENIDLNIWSWWVEPTMIVENSDLNIWSWWVAHE